MATSSPFFVLISTFLTIKEITSSSIGYATLVPYFILQFLILLCIFWDSRKIQFLILLCIFWVSRSKQRESDIRNFEDKAYFILLFLILLCIFWDSRKIQLIRLCIFWVSRSKQRESDIRNFEERAYFILQFLIFLCIFWDSRKIQFLILLCIFWDSRSKQRESDIRNFEEKAGSWMLIDRGFGVVIAEKVVITSLSSSPRVLFKRSVDRNNYSRSRPPQELELVKIVDKLLAKLWAHIGDGSGEDRAIQDDWGSHDTTVNSSVQMTSPPPKTTPQTAPPPTPPPQTLRATPQVQPPTPAPQVQPPTPTPQVQPPTPTTTPAPPPPPPPRGWFNFNLTGWFTFNFAGWFNLNVADLAKIFLAISATLVLAPPQIVQSGGNSLSANDKTLLFGTKLFGLAGFIFCLLAYIVRQDNKAAKLLIAFGVVAVIFGLLLIVALGR